MSGNKELDKNPNNQDVPVSLETRKPALRTRAEEKAQLAVDYPQLADGYPTKEIDTLTPEVARRMLHELHVHQIELEIQNEELRRTQVELEASRARYFDLYELAPVGYCTLNEAGFILKANLTASTLLGVARGSLLKLLLSRFILKEDQGAYFLCRKKLLETRQVQACELRMRKGDGSPFWGHLEISASYEDEPVLRMILSDVTNRKQSELELTKAIAVAEKANLAKTEFLSNMSHELRTPLTAILGFAQLMEISTPPPPPTYLRNLEQIRRAGWHLTELINEILDLALVESGKLSLSLHPVSLTEIALECQAMVEAQAQQHNILVSFPESGVPYLVEADRIRLKQILLNLLSNAIKYNKEGGSVTVSYLPQSKERIRICVEDTGLGLPPDKLSQLFQPFNRLGQEKSDKEGTGIGLVVCKRLSELMGGSIGVESTLDKGSTFWLELNVALDTEALSLLVF